jgi:hypothetical protein
MKQHRLHPLARSCLLMMTNAETKRFRHECGHDLPNLEISIMQKDVAIGCAVSSTRYQKKEDMGDIQRASQYELFLDRLRRVRSNDAATTMLIACDYSWPLGYGRHLGEALHNNTAVSTLILNVNAIVDSGEEYKEYNDCKASLEPGVRFNPRFLDVYSGCAALLLRYIQTSAALRVMGLQEGRSPATEAAKSYFPNLVVMAIAQSAPDPFSVSCEATTRASVLSLVYSTVADIADSGYVPL